MPDRPLPRRPPRLAAGAVHLLARRRGGDPGWRAVAGLLWFLVAHAVESSVVPVADLMVEHRMYLPSAGLVLALSAAALVAGAALAARAPRLEHLPAAALGIAAIVLAGATHARNEVWRDEIRLWGDSAAKAPGKRRPAHNLGVALLNAGRTAEAIPVLQRAVEIDPAYPSSQFQLSRAHGIAGQHALAAHRELELATSLAPATASGHVALGEVLLARGEAAAAARAFERAAALAPADPGSRRGLAEANRRLGRDAPPAAPAGRAARTGPGP